MPDIPIIVRSEIYMLCFRVSKADERSSRISWQQVMLYCVSIMEDSCFSRMDLKKIALKRIKKIIIIYMGDKLFEYNSF